FGQDCTVCHATSGWNDVIFDHNDTNFPLTDSHDGPACADCHFDGYVGTPTDCQYCHFDQYSQTQNPPHTIQIWVISDCANCHNAVDWVPSIFDHLPPPVTCNVCHLNSLMQANQTVPGHSTLPIDCAGCHTTDLWSDMVFDHSVTGFPLDGVHGETACQDCHPSAFLNTSPLCSDCHLDSYINTTDPDHEAQGWVAADCEFCHDASGWTPSIFDHLTVPNTPCINCHQPQWIEANTLNPDHELNGQDCGGCHSFDNWSDVVVDHSLANTGFELGGLHLDLLCSQCHPNGFDNGGVIRDCASTDCHLTTYTESGEPHHFTTPAGGYPLEYCANCHDDNTAGFNPSIYSHGTVNTGCYTCHEYDYESVVSPDHVGLGYSQNCDNCHIEDNWQAVDPHQAPVGPCGDCHNYNGNNGDPLPSIDHTTAPKLGASIDDCQNCHNNTNNWQNVVFSSSRHDGSTYQIYFDIYGGEHNGEWGNSCSNNCHTFGAFDTYSCWDNCHANKHLQSRMLDEHCGGGGDDDMEDDTLYPSRVCVSCTSWNPYWYVNLQYQDGSWSNPATFVQCYQCHPNGDKNGPCGDD
ncbi:MAG: hypothetical protein GXO91_11195, partial [FCB group bacterium]|nr:hypothetical protein [FCB group bacterium]